jgi:hypothetical protein
MDNILQDFHELPLHGTVMYRSNTHAAAMNFRRKLYRIMAGKDYSPELLAIMACTKISVIDNCVILKYNAPPQKVNQSC